MTGRVVHFEVPFSDGDRARNFYKQIFGWQLNEMPEMRYTIVSTGPSAEACSNASLPFRRAR
jgi:predicted enzyme related to lactoylglutathione lyase